MYFSCGLVSFCFPQAPPLRSPLLTKPVQIYLTTLSPPSEPRLLSSGGTGATSFPLFSPNGELLAWLEQRVDGYESDRNRLMVHSLSNGITFGLTENWDRSPIGIRWGLDGTGIYIRAEEEGYVKVFYLPVPGAPNANGPHPKSETPKLLLGKHSNSEVQPLPKQRLLITENSLISPNELYLVTLPTSESGEPTTVKVSNFSEKALKGKNLHKGEEFWFTVRCAKFG